jgi:hypothetical protein
MTDLILQSWRDALLVTHANPPEEKQWCRPYWDWNYFFIPPTFFGFANARLQGGLTSQRADGAEISDKILRRVPKERETKSLKRRGTE